MQEPTFHTIFPFTRRLSILLVPLCYSPSYLSDNSGKFSAPNSQPVFVVVFWRHIHGVRQECREHRAAGRVGLWRANRDGGSIMGWGIILPHPRMKRLAEMIAYCLMVTIKSGFKHFITFCIQTGFREEN